LALAEKSQDELRIEEKLGRMGATFLLRRAPGDLERALRYLSRARDLAERVGQKEHAGFWTTRLGDGYRELGHKQQALEQYAEARRFGETVNYSRIIREAALGQGELLEREGDLKGALAAYDETIRLLERERDQFLLEREKEAFFEDKLDVYERVVNVLLDLYDREHDPKYGVQQRLGAQEILIDYHMQQGSTVAFIIGKERIERVRCRSDAIIERS
jgi:tetratricopeptide (TPR) repeat protein